MHLRTHASMKKLSVGSSRNTFSTLLLHYRVEVWGGSIPKSTWKEFENAQKHFLTKFLQVKKETPYTLLLLETGSLPIEIKNVPHIDFLEFHGKQAKRSKRRIKAKFCVPVGCKIWKNGLVDEMQYTEAFLQCQCIMTWEKCGGSSFTHYTTHVAPNYKTIFFAKRGNCTHRYILEPIPLSSIRIIASMRISSHALRCETGRLGKSDESGRLCTICPKQVRKSEYHTLIQRSAFYHI